MINPRISAVWSTTKPIAPFLCTPSVQEVHTKDEVVHFTPGLLYARFSAVWRVIIQLSRIGNVLRNI